MTTYRPQPLVVDAPTLLEGAGTLTRLAELWATFTGRGERCRGA